MDICAWSLQIIQQWLGTTQGQRTSEVWCFTDSHSSRKEYEQVFQFHLLRQSEPLECEVITQGRQVEGSKSPDLNI